MSGGRIRELFVVARNYPSPARPTDGTFVRAMIESYVRAGASARVCSPRKLWEPAADTVETPEGVEPSLRLEVRRPAYLPLSNKQVAGFSTQRAGQWSFDWAVARAARGAKPDATYSHFLFPAGGAASRVAKRLGIPSFLAMGEGNPHHYFEHFGVERTKLTLRGLTGVLAASPDNRDFCIQEAGLPAERILTIPNAADPDRFHPRDRAEMRRKHGLPLDRTLVVFVGDFDENKGAQRLARAIDQVPGLGGIFLGGGPLPPEGANVVKAGKVPYTEVPEWLSAADFFALPTLRECSSNALAEAVAAGLPVVSSDIANTRAMIDPAWAVLADPSDVDAIAKALARIAEDPGRRAEMSRAALAHGQANSIDARAARALAWMNEFAR